MHVSSVHVTCNVPYSGLSSRGMNFHEILETMNHLRDEEMNWPWMELSFYHMLTKIKIMKIYFEQCLWCILENIN